MSGEAPPGPAPPRLRRAEPGDAAAVAALERESFADPWSEESVRSEIALPVARVLVAHAPEDGPGAPPAAYAVFRLGYEEAELLRVGVRKDRRRAGLARALVERGLAGLRHDGCRACHLEVRRGNLPALALYDRLGFVRVGLRPGYYRDGEDAVLMRLALAPEEGSSP